MNGTGKQGYTVWHYIGCGCVALVILGAIIMAGLAWFGINTAKNFERNLEDPEARLERAQEVLGFETLPEGYYPGITFSVPFLMTMTTLGDLEPEPYDEESADGSVQIDFDEEDFFGQRGFQFFRVRGDAGEAEVDMDDAVYRKTQLSRGEIEAGGATVTYRTYRGQARMDRERVPGIVANLTIDCPGDSSYLRMASWFFRGDAAAAVADAERGTWGDEEEDEAWGEDETVEEVTGETDGTVETSAETVPQDAEAIEAEIEASADGTEDSTSEVADADASEIEVGDLTGTPADPEALKAFLDHFDLCRK